MPPHEAAWSARHVEACSQVFEGLSVREVAKRMGLNESTVRRWSERPEWAAHTAVLEANAIESTVARLRRLVGRATRKLEGVLDNPEAGDADTLRAVFGLYDRIGLGPSSFVTTNNGTMTVEEAEDQILKRAQAIRERRGEKASAE